MKRFLILGGYGNTGYLIAYLLLKHTKSNVIISGRNAEKAKAACLKLSEAFSGERVSYSVCDASDKNSLLNDFRYCDFVIAASSTSEYVQNVVEAALGTGIDYLDVQVSSKKIEYLRTIEDKINSSGKVFITDGGFHPGLPAAMVRYAASFFDQLTKANVGSLIYIDWKNYFFSPATRIELVSEFMNFNIAAFKEGKWQKLKLSDKSLMKEFDFKESYKKIPAFAMYLEEMKVLTDTIPSIKETGFFVQGFDKITNYITLPFIIMLLNIFPRLTQAMGSLFEWSLKKFSKPPFFCILKLEAEGLLNEKHKTFGLTIQHEDGYLLTAVPIVATLIQYIDGLVKPGLWCMAHYPEPAAMMHDMKQMGLDITSSEEFQTLSLL